MQYKYNHKFSIMIATENNDNVVYLTIQTSTPYKEVDKTLLSMLHIIFRDQLGSDRYCMVILKHLVAENK